MNCKKCNGSGFISYFENQSPLGSGMVWYEEIIDLCQCLDNDICPSCGMFWRGENGRFNEYCDGNGERFGCIFCLWASDDPPKADESFEMDYWFTPEEIFKAPARREN
jgi:hypothetical protein